MEGSEVKKSSESKISFLPENLEALIPDEYKLVTERMKEESQGIFSKLLSLMSPTLRLSGSFLAYCLHKELCMRMHTKKPNTVPFGDIDFWILCEDRNEACRLLKQVYLPALGVEWESKQKRGGFFQFGDTTRFTSPNHSFSIQFIRLDPSNGYITRFDLSHVQWDFDGQSIRGTPAAFRTLRTGLVTTHAPVMGRYRLNRVQDMGFRLDPTNVYKLGVRYDEYLEEDTANRVLIAEDKLQQEIETEKEYFVERGNKFSLPLVRLSDFQSEWTRDDVYKVFKTHDTLEIRVPPQVLPKSKFIEIGKDMVGTIIQPRELFPNHFFLHSRIPSVFTLVGYFNNSNTQNNSASSSSSLQSSLPDCVSFDIHLSLKEQAYVSNIKFFSTQ